ncbi:MAG: hypothetical protein M0R68_03990 [Bacteroidetes bacterium]|nr:hypothetical protein [Bacteroidota bacterium]
MSKDLTPGQIAARTRMTAAEERAFDVKAEKHFRGHRELPNGRNFRCWNREKDVAGDRAYRANYDQIDWNTSPVSA